MSLKASYWWQMRDHKKAVQIYYFVLVCVVIMMFVNSGDIVSSESLMQGFDLITVIFLFVMGLCSFKENFGMLLQNCVSRKTVFIGRIMTTLSIAFGMAVIDRVFMIICNLLFSRNGTAFVRDLYAAFYSTKIDNVSEFTGLVSGFALSFCLYLCILTLGYVITILFYRLGKGGKIALGVGVPVTYTILLPFVDSRFFHGKLGEMFEIFIDFAFGITAVKPQNLMISSLLLAAIVSILIWLLMRKAVLKA